jgi:hypothetical protein
VSSPHPPVHDDLMRAVRAGERDEAAPEFRQLLDTCPQCAASWGRLQGVAARLTAAARAQHRSIEAAARRPAGPGEERIDATLARLAREEPHRAPRRSRRWLWLAAAGVVLAGGLAWRAHFGPPEDQDHEVPLGDGLRLLAPIGAVSASEFPDFRWEYDGDPPGGFELRIYSEDERDEPVVTKLLKTRAWTPSPEERRALPARIIWEVDAIGAFGPEDLLAASHESAWLSP